MACLQILFAASTESTSSSFRNALESRIESSSIKYGMNLFCSCTNKDSISCAKEIKQFQDKVDYEFRDSTNKTPEFVTEDAYKFLYYYAGYILERLPEIPNIIPVEINSISPNYAVENSPKFSLKIFGTGFNNSSKLYFNEKEKLTKYISDKELSSVILNSDVKQKGNYLIKVKNSDETVSNEISFKVISRSELIDSIRQKLNALCGGFTNPMRCKILIKKIEALRSYIQKNNLIKAKQTISELKQDFIQTKKEGLSEKRFQLFNQYLDMLLSSLTNVIDSKLPDETE